MPPPMSAVSVALVAPANEVAFCADWPPTHGHAASERNDEKPEQGEVEKSGDLGQKSGAHSEKSGAASSWTDACAALLCDARVMLFAPPSAVMGANGAAGADAASVYAEPACVGVVDLACVAVF